MVLCLLYFICFLVESAESILKPQSIEEQLLILLKIGPRNLEILFLLLTFDKHHVDFH